MKKSFLFSFEQEPMALGQTDIQNCVCDPLIGIDFEQHHLIRKGNFIQEVNFH